MSPEHMSLPNQSHAATARRWQMSAVNPFHSGAAPPQGALREMAERQNVARPRDEQRPSFRPCPQSRGGDARRRRGFVDQHGTRNPEWRGSVQATRAHRQTQERGRQLIAGRQRQTCVISVASER